MVARKKKTLFTVNRIWLIVFGCWGIFLSGIFASMVGSPGIIQAIYLKGLLESKRAKISQLQTEIDRLDSERIQLDKNRYVQEREIRKILGYAASDEMIFDFGAGDSIR